MNKAQRLREVLNLFDNGSIIKFPSTDENNRYGMDDNGRLGCLIYDAEKS